MKNIEKRLGAVVKSLRQAAGMTQEKLAQLMTAEGHPTRQNTVAKLEGGLRPTPVAEFGALARIFNLTVPEFADAVFAGENNEASKRAMTDELRGLYASMDELRTNLGYLQDMMSEVRNALMEREMRAALLEAHLGTTEVDGKKYEPPRAAELDGFVKAMLASSRGAIDGKHSEEA
ncbi:helix-turn-helix domain-containing protein [Arthrobacter pascens]|uniref:helix-turn-helix domain-containing protein n=1 Tax=Arthrobacter pascens TaxID=1677 RepID=UPI0027D7832F|nr:helix-turn-helix transcriptional regulator [Arthrobacter pascens]